MIRFTLCAVSRRMFVTVQKEARTPTKLRLLSARDERPHMNERSAESWRETILSGMYHDRPSRSVSTDLQMVRSDPAGTPIGDSSGPSTDSMHDGRECLIAGVRS